MLKIFGLAAKSRGLGV